MKGGVRSLSVFLDTAGATVADLRGNVTISSLGTSSREAESFPDHRPGNVGGPGPCLTYRALDGVIDAITFGSQLSEVSNLSAALPTEFATRAAHRVDRRNVRHSCMSNPNRISASISTMSTVPAASRPHSTV